MSRQERVKELLDLALRREPAERASFLDRACGDDGALRTELASLLEAHDASRDFLESSAVERLGALLPEPPRLEPGRRIARYEIRGVLGAGGGGTVYRALQARPQRPVALKVMAAGLDSASARRRFEEEAEILARLQHPGIATVFEAGVHDDLPWFALEYVDGIDLVLFARERSLDARQRVALMIDVCDAVHHGHESGIVHRDLKPGNILVDASGRPKIIDFGIARAVETDAREHGMVGTLPYTSPEQCASGEAIDAQSDVYALGVLLFQLLSGRLPHDVEGTSIPEAMRRIRELPPAPLPRETPADLAAIVRRALARGKAERYASAADLAGDLRRWLAHRPVAAFGGGPLYRMRKFARRQRTAFLSTGTVVLLAVAALFLPRRGPTAPGPPPAPRPEPEPPYLALLAGAAEAIEVGDLDEARLLLDRAPEPRRNWEWRYLRRCTDRSAWVLRWPDAVIRTGAVSGDGRWAAATGRRPDRTHEVRVWDLRTRERVASIEVGERFPYSLALDARGARLALGFFDGGIEVREARSGDVLVRPAGHDGNVTQMLFHPEGAWLASASADRTIKLWSLPSGGLLRTLRGHEDRVVCISLGPHAEHLASGGREGKVRLWDLAGDADPVVVGSHSESVDGVAFGPQGERIASGSRDSYVCLWSVGGDLLARHPHADVVRAVAFAPDGGTFLSASWDSTLGLWDGAGRSLGTLTGHTGRIMAVHYGEDPNRAYSFCDDGTVRAWDLARRDRLYGFEGDVAAVAFVDAHMLATASTDGRVRLWDLATAGPPAVLPAPADGAPQRLLVAAGGKALYCAGENLRAWPLPVGECLLREGEPILAVDPDGTVVLSRGERGFVREWEPATGRERRTGRLHDAAVLSLAVDPTGERVASGSAAGEVKLWNRGSFEEIASFGSQGGEGGGVRRLVFSADGAKLGAVWEDGIVRVLDGRTLAERFYAFGFSVPVRDLAFSPDGRRVAGCGGRELRIWDADSGDLLLLVPGPPSQSTLAFGPDGDIIVTGGPELRIYDAR